VIFSRKSLSIVISLGAIVIAALFGVYGKKWLKDAPDPRLATPAVEFQELLKSNASCFVTPELLSFTSSWAALQRERLPSLGDSIAASRDKSIFWRLNRERHFTVVLLGANPAWHPLVNSLLDSSLWILSDVSPWGYLFKPRMDGVAEWKIPSETELKNQWPDINNRTRFLILTAINLTAINRLSEAEQLLNRAATTHRLTPLLQSTQASLAASRGHWEDAAVLSRESLRSDHSNRAASEILIRALIETGHTNDALDQARDLVEQLGEDEASLFLLARAANASNSGKEEIDALARLVAVARRDHQPLGASLTYLGQAYAKQGDRGDALRSFQEAALAPEISEAERKSLRGLMDFLMQGDRSSSTLPALPAQRSNP
jgi:hypothetical protein